MKKCRFCTSTQIESFVDLGMSPISNAYLPPNQLLLMEPFYPLHCYVCASCFLVQLEPVESPENLFGEYAYFSSYSDSWLRHAQIYKDYITSRLALNHNSYVVEIASNDGYLLQYFLAQGIPVLGVEPAANVAQLAIDKGIPTLVEFFGSDLAAQLFREGKQADLIVGNNVLAHVPDLNDFVAGLKILLKPDGVITMEFPHLLRLITDNQFDTIYHEHFCYFSFTSAERIFAAHNLRLFDVQELDTHGGSLRIYACHTKEATKPTAERTIELKRRENSFGINRIETYQVFSDQVRKSKRKILRFLIQAKEEGKKIVGYGAPAKGNTLLNYCGIRNDFLEYTVDRSPHKQGKFLPGTHIPIQPPEMVAQSKPDYLFILPWNIKAEIMEQMAFIREWGGKFVVPIPEITIY